MWGSRRNRDREVVCIACGTTLPRGEAREYDKEGDRWQRRGKEFEYLCKGCHRTLCHQPRDGLEALLERVEDESRDGSPEAFVRAYQNAVAERTDD